MELFIPDQSVGNISESMLDRLPVSDQSLLVLGLRQSQIPAKGPTCEDRLAALCTIRPDANLRSHEAGEGAAPSKRAAACSGQSDLGKKLSFGHANLCVRGDQNLLGLANIRTALNDGRRKAGWNFGRKSLLHQWKPARYVVWVVSEQDADGIFFLSNQSLQIRYLRICCVENLLGLEYVKFCSDTAIKPELSQFDRIGLCPYCLASDLELKIKLQESEVVTRKVADKGQDHRLTCILCSQELGACGFGGPTQAAKEIELKGRISGECQEVELGLDDIFFATAESGVAR